MPKHNKYYALSYSNIIFDNLSTLSFKKFKRILFVCANIFTKKLRKNVRQAILKANNKLELELLQNNMRDYLSLAKANMI